MEDEPAFPPTDQQPNAGPAEAPDAIVDDNREFLVELGKRVRQMRSVRAMSRKTLARISGISERYLAQLESGTGNLSIMLLRRVAQATATPVEDLVADAPPPQEWPLIRELLRRAPPGAVHKVKALLNAESGAETSHPAPAVMVNRIALIGMRGAGKTTLGRIAAERLRWPFIELNTEIETTAGLSLAEIFRLYGHDGYRRLEEKALRKVITRPGPMLLAASGGIVADPVAFDVLITSFFTVWVRAQPEDHMKRIRQQDAMPANVNEAGNTVIKDELLATLATREPYYARARAVLETSEADVAASANKLVELITHYCERSCPWALRHGL